MTRILACFSALLILASCGGSGSSSTLATGGSEKMFATGLIYSACTSSGRKQASNQRCGCVQAVANTSLSRDEQRKGAAFFSDPQRAQNVRQSDSGKDERFWTKWKAFSDRAAQICT